MFSEISSLFPPTFNIRWVFKDSINYCLGLDLNANDFDEFRVAMEEAIVFMKGRHLRSFFVVPCNVGAPPPPPRILVLEVSEKLDIHKSLITVNILQNVRSLRQSVSWDLNDTARTLQHSRKLCFCISLWHRSSWGTCMYVGDTYVCRHVTVCGSDTEFTACAPT